MAAPVRPSASKAFGTKKIIYCPTSTASVATLTGGTALDVTKMAYKSTPDPSASTNLVESPPRVGDTETYQFVGETTWTIGELRYQFDPQGAALSDGRKASEKFNSDPVGFVYIRRGKNRDTDLAVSDKVERYPVELGPEYPIEEGDGEGAENGRARQVTVTGPPDLDIVLVS